MKYKLSKTPYTLSRNVSIIFNQTIFSWYELI